MRTDVVLYDWNNDGVYDHEAIVTASDSTNPDGSTNWDLVGDAGRRFESVRGLCKSPAKSGFLSFR
jgi:hypothetical protein